MRAHRIFITVIVSLFIATGLVHAQIPGSDMAELNISPAIPGPNQEVTAILQSYLSDLNKAQISWLVNGQNVDSGIGLKRFTFKTGPLGTQTEISVIAVTSEGYPISEKLIINPAKVDLVYEADSYTPPFYKGRAYFPYSGQARIVATPSFVDSAGQPIPTRNLIFTWKDGEKTLESGSGIGRDVLSYKNNNLLPKDADISVEVSSSDQKYIAKASITLEPTAPKVVLYEKDPLLGVLYNKALKEEHTLKNSEMSIAAAPYFFGVSSPKSSLLKYEWSLNGTPAQSTQDIAVFKKPASQNGTADISLQLSNTKDYFQFGNARVSINFNGSGK
jgi:hypothetical protein